MSGNYHHLHHYQVPMGIHEPFDNAAVGLCVVSENIRNLTLEYVHFIVF